MKGMLVDIYHVFCCLSITRITSSHTIVNCHLLRTCVMSNTCIYIYIYIYMYMYCMHVGEKKLGRVICPDPWKSGARNTIGEWENGGETLFPDSP